MGLKSWGLLPYEESQLIELTRFDVEANELKRLKQFIPAGLARSYGDVGLNPAGVALSTASLDRFIAFDEETGVLECEPGVSIRDIQHTFSPRGWISPVTPGTSYVTVAGAIANDVHGKNHHSKGSFGNHVIELTLLRTDRSSLLCSREINQDYFRSTIGGLGLTGVIVRAKIQLAKINSPWVESETLPFRDLDEFFQLSDASQQDFESSVAWFDCSTRKAGRGSFIRGNHSLDERQIVKSGEPKLSIPVTPPFSLVNKVTLNPLNSSYYMLKRLTGGKRLESLWSFYYPLDGIKNWNRAYGPKGFYQYQSVVPNENRVEATKEMLRVISKSGLGSFLAVLKTFGEIRSQGMLSFPKPGVTLALDFPNEGHKTKDLFNKLDQIVLAAGGRLNPSKDARMSRESFVAGYPAHEEFLRFRDPGISSGFSKRIFGN